MTTVDVFGLVCLVALPALILLRWCISLRNLVAVAYPLGIYLHTFHASKCREFLRNADIIKTAYNEDEDREVAIALTLHEFNRIFDAGCKWQNQWSTK